MNAEIFKMSEEWNRSALSELCKRLSTRESVDDFKAMSSDPSTVKVIWK